MGQSRPRLAFGLGLGVNPVVRKFITGVVAVNAIRANPPVHVLSDEKFATLTGEQIYLFLLAQEELIWSTAWMESTDEAAFNEVIMTALGEIEQGAQKEEKLAPEKSYQPESVTTDGWKPVQNAWETQVPGIDLIECNLHGRKRVDATLDAYAQTHPDLSEKERQQIKDDFNHIFAAPTLSRLFPASTAQS